MKFSEKQKIRDRQIPEYKRAFDKAFSEEFKKGKPVDVQSLALRVLLKLGYSADPAESLASPGRLNL